MTGDKATNPDYVWKGYRIYHSQLHVGQAQPQALFTLAANNTSDTSFPSWGENIYPFDVNGDRHTDLLVTAATQFGVNWDGYKIYAANNEGTHLMFATESTGNTVFGKDNSYAKVDKPHRAQQTLTSYYAPTQSLVYNTVDYGCAPAYFANRIRPVQSTAPATARPSSSSAAVEVLPNPSARYFDIHVPAATVTYYALLDLSGRVLQAAATSGTDHFNLDGVTLPPGLYVLRLTTSHGPLQAKLVKSN